MIFEQLEQVLDLHFGECTCKHKSELKLNKLEASMDISSVFLTMLQPLVLQEDEVIEQWKKKMSAVIEYLKIADKSPSKEA